MAMTPQKKPVRSFGREARDPASGRVPSMAFAVLVIALVAIVILVLTYLM